MKRFIYLAGPISGVSYNEAMNWREYVSNKFNSGIFAVSPMRLKEFLRGVESIDHSYPEELMSNTKSIYSRDFYDCAHCDILFVYLPRELNERRPSIGTLVELGWASARDIPVVLVTDDDNYKNHPLVYELASWVVDTLDEGVEIVNGVLDPYLYT